jgi:uncharacterized UPF0160 family protein
LKFLLLIWALLAPPLCSGAEISEQLSVYREVKPDIYLFPVEVKSEGKREEEVIENLSTVNSLLKSLNIPYKGGSLYLSPKLKWNSTKRAYERLGFVGKVKYIFLLKEPVEQDYILKTLEEAKKRAKFVYFLEEPRWELSKEKRREVEKELRRQLLQELVKEAKAFSKILGKKCYIESVSFESPSRFPIYKAASSPKSPAPILENKEIKVSARAKLECQ